jgi:phosphohistidine swiveling domain-containing protein
MKGKKIWRKNFEIKNTHFLMGTPAIQDMIDYQDVTVGKKILNEVVWVQKDYDNLATYFVKKELRGLIEKTIEMILNNPARIKKIHKKDIYLNKDFFSYSKSLLKINASKLSNGELGKILNKLFQHQMLSHGYALPTTWFLDSDDEDFTKLLLKRLEIKIKENKTNFPLPEVFSILTTPEKPSFAMVEEKESFMILKAISADKKAKKIFLQKNLADIASSLSEIEPKLKRKIINHYQKWRWVPYTYIGPAYDLDYYLEIWSGLLKENIDINKHLEKIDLQIRELKPKKGQIIKELKLSRQDIELFEIASEIIYLKSYRKDCWFLGCYAIEPILKETAKRMHLTLKQVRFMDWKEIAPALEKGFFSSDILNKRIEFSIFYQQGQKRTIYHTVQAKKFLSKLNLEKEEVKKTDHLQGTCACPGKAKGEVKIINLPDEMNKMNKGDVMVAHTTFPALVPAMKKASAIVTDDGGITCHAAIVARELKIPCVVGTKFATQVFHDGQLVEVDADKGTIKITK